MLTISPISNNKTNFKSGKTGAVKAAIGTVKKEAQYSGSGNMAPQVLGNWLKKYYEFANRLAAKEVRQAEIEEYLKSPSAKIAVMP